jgi:hypothetical protein
MDFEWLNHTFICFISRMAAKWKRAAESNCRSVITTTTTATAAAAAVQKIKITQHGEVRLGIKTKYRITEGSLRS